MALLFKLQSKSWQETGCVREPAIELLTNVVTDMVDLPMASIVCTATLGAPISGQELMRTLGIINDSDRMIHTNYGWPLTDIVRMEPPVPARGRQGLWHWDEVAP